MNLFDTITAAFAGLSSRSDQPTDTDFATTVLDAISNPADASASFFTFEFVMNEVRGLAEAMQGRHEVETFTLEAGQTHAVVRWLCFWRALIPDKFATPEVDALFRAYAQWASPSGPVLDLLGVILDSDRSLGSVLESLVPVTGAAYNYSAHLLTCWHLDHLARYYRRELP